jgi:hypothetical protein
LINKQLDGNEDNLWAYLPLDDFAEIPTDLSSEREASISVINKNEDIKKAKYDHISYSELSRAIYVDGELLKSTDTIDAAIAFNSAPLLIGKDVAGSAMSGGIDGIRLWSKPRPQWAIDLFRMNNIKSQLRLTKAEKDGLVADWAFREKDGTVATDRVHNLPLVVKDLETGKETKRDPLTFFQVNFFRAQWHIYINGISQEVTLKLDKNINTVADKCDEVATGPESFKLGITTSKARSTFKMDDVRLWDRIRTQEQVKDNMYRRLSGDREKALTAYWQFGDLLNGTNTGRGHDDSLNKHQLKIGNSNTGNDQTVPLGRDHPVVVNTLGGQQKPQSARLKDTVSVAEYNDIEQDFDGNLFAVLKRAYVFADQDLDGMRLVTGFKVDNLEMIFLGMAQSQPTLIGYLEGPPPVPGENLTRPYWTAFNKEEYARYNDASTIQLTESQERNYFYSSSTANSSVTEFSSRFGFAVDVENKFVTPGGAFLLKDLKTKIGGVIAGSESSGTPKTLSKSVSLSKTLTEQMALQGGWQPRDQVKDLGDRRFIPANKGYALVKSATANEFLLRLEGSKTPVGTQLIPNANTPQDWNIITFPINPKYVKNGTLDGRVGFKNDPDFPQTDERDTVFNQQENSYFKPREAFGLKQRINREEKRLESFF